MNIQKETEEIGDKLTYDIAIYTKGVGKYFSLEETADYGDVLKISNITILDLMMVTRLLKANCEETNIVIERIHYNE